MYNSQDEVKELMEKKNETVDFKKTFEAIMVASESMALATCVDNSPNVRVVNFCYDPKQPSVAYFGTDRGDAKVEEFAHNPTVAFTTLPRPGEIGHIRARNATVRKSDRSIMEMKDLFLAQIPGYGEAIEVLAATLELYEIHFREVKVILGMDSAKMLTL